MDNSKNNSNVLQELTTWSYNYRLGYTNLYIRNIGTQALMSHDEELDDGSTLPIHPLLGFEKFFHLFMRSLTDPNKAELEGWLNLAKLAFDGLSQLSLLKGITLHDSRYKKYTLYAKKDHEILAAPGRNAQTIVTNQFNFIEVSVIIN